MDSSSTSFYRRVSTSWSQKFIASQGPVSQPELDFIDTISAAFDPSFEVIFGSDRILGHLNRTLNLARRLGTERFVLDVTVGQTANLEKNSLVQVAIDIASQDQAYLVDSFLALFARFSIVPALSLHPLVVVQRGTNGNILAAAFPGSRLDNARLESYVHFDLLVDENMVSAATISEQLMELFSFLAVVKDDQDFLQDLVSRCWGPDLKLRSDEFVVLGAYSNGTPLGILRNMSSGDLSRVIDNVDLPQNKDTWHLVPLFSPLISGEALMVSPRLSSGFDGSICAEFVVGLPLRSLDSLSAKTAPALEKVRRSIAIPLESYSYRELGELLVGISSYEIELSDTSDTDTFLSTLLLARETNRVAVLPSVLCAKSALRIYIYIPTKRYRSKMPGDIRSLILRARGEIDVSCLEASVDQSSVRLDLDLISLIGDDLSRELISLCDLVSTISDEVSRTWSDQVAEILAGRHGEVLAGELCRKYQGVFDYTYQNDYSPHTGADDIDRIESALSHDNVWVGFTSGEKRDTLTEINPGQQDLRLRILNLGERRKLSSLLPLVETFGISVVDEIPYELRFTTLDQVAWLYDLGVELDDGHGVLVQEVLDKFCITFADVFQGDLDQDLLNSLVLKAGLNTNGLVLLRTLAYYQRFCSSGASVNLAISTIASYSDVARAIVEYFAARFSGDSTQILIDRSHLGVLSLIDEVPILEHDQFFRQLVRICDATVRTNLYVRDRPYVPAVIKLSSHEIPGLGNPIPLVETFVFAPNVEGIHMRSALVARGGIRYSDRIDDYRVEILGLMKAQSVKNAVIVPHGAKGGFVLRGNHRANQSVELGYDAFISALLSITDNIVDQTVIHPNIGPIYDGDDPYLVVAADKGTASFSDRANAIALGMNYWLGDAFASGGSSGFDHKELGITAKGAWVSVQHHFSKLKKNPHVDPIITVGIGDMSGDVFGNGMLLSNSLKLVAAFDHRDIFLDPNPSASVSYQERRRLFELPKSSWQLYSSDLISAGGGVFSRKSKSITLSRQAANVLGATPGSYSPSDLIKIILTAPVDLIWNGGIGTYIRSSSEENSAIGDKSNDLVRVEASKIRAKVIGEGGNLGISQLARMELAARHVLLNTDAIDNSAGVDTSDHEVNLKILYDNSKELRSTDRNDLLRSLATDVEELVLSDNVWQNWSLTVAETEFDQMRGAYSELIELLEANGGLNREVEFVTAPETLLSGYTLTRPELSVLLAYEKLRLKEEFLRLDVAMPNSLSSLGLEYFPNKIRVAIEKDVTLHPLWRELVSNYLVNTIVNIAGPTYMMRTVEESSHDFLDVSSCFFLTDRICGTRRKLLDLINDDELTFDQALQGFLGTVRFHERATRWMLRDVGRVNAIKPERLKECVTLLLSSFFDLVPPKYKDQIVLDGELALHDSRFWLGAYAPFATSIMEIAALVVEKNLPDVSEFAKRYFSVGELLEIPNFLSAASMLPRTTNWERQVRIAVRDEIDSVHIQALNMLLKLQNSDQIKDAETRLAEAGSRIIDTDHAFNNQEKVMPARDLLAMLVVGARNLKAAVEGR